MAEARSWRSFLTWLKTQQDRTDPIGDLARDAAGDEDPDVPDSPAGFVQYVGHIGSVEAQEAAIRAAAEYLAWDQAEL